MSRDDIIEILEWHPSHVEHGKSGLLSRIERVVAVAVAAEREACAKVCDFEVARLTAIDEPRAALAVGICAAAIRARGQQ